jgi:hypothetical protein
MERNQEEQQFQQHTPTPSVTIPRESVSDSPLQVQHMAHRPTLYTPSATTNATNPASVNDTTISTSAAENYIEAQPFNFMSYRDGDPPEANNTTHDNRRAEVLLTEEQLMQDIFNFVDMDGGSDSIFGFGQLF